MILTLLVALIGSIPGSLQTGTSAGVNLDHIANPCTKEALEAGNYHHPYPSDPSKYIQCTEWGNYHVMSCYPGFWDNLSQTCLLQEGGSQESQYTMGAGSNYARFGQSSQGNNWGQAGSGSVLGQADQKGNILAEKAAVMYGTQQASMTQMGNQQQFSKSNGQTQNTVASWRLVGGSGNVGSLGQSAKHSQMANQPPATEQNTFQVQNKVSAKWFGQGQTQTARASILQQQQQQNQRRQQYVRAWSDGSMKAAAQMQGFQKSASGMKSSSSGSQSIGQGFMMSAERNQKAASQVGQGMYMGQAQAGLPNTNHPNANSKGVMQASMAGTYQSQAAKANYNQQSTAKSGHEWVQTVDMEKSMKGDSNRMLEILNPCRQPSTQFVSNPTNPFNYWECVNGQAVERECPTDSVWIQRAKECRSLKQRLGSGSSQYQNPCLGRIKFLPYLGDDSKYIECIGWYRQEVRQCPDNHAWSQEHQVCVPKPRQRQPAQQPNQPPVQQPVQQPNQPPVQQQRQWLKQGTSYQSGDNKSSFVRTMTGGGTVNEFCLNTDSYYHPYPPKSNMYVQCDEFGNMYLRFCGPNKRWDDVMKTCVGNQTVMESAVSREGQMSSGSAASQSFDSNLYMKQGSDLRMSADQGRAAANQQMSNKIMTSEPFLCPDGMQWVAGSGRCMTVDGKSAASHGQFQCPEGMVWLDTVNGCVNLVGAAQLFNQIVPVGCPRLYVYVAQAGQCQQQQGQQSGEPVPALNRLEPQCDEGFIWDSQMSMCIKKLSPEMFTTMNDMAKKEGDDAVFTLRGPVLRVGGVPAEGDSTKGMQSASKGDNMMSAQNGQAFVQTGNANNGIMAGNGNGVVFTSGMTSSTHMFTSNNTGSSYSMMSAMKQGYSSNAVASSSGIATSGMQSGMLLTDMNGEPIHTNGRTDNSDTIPVSVEGNPCETGEGFYHSYPADPRYFIQCDEFGGMFVHPCGYSLVWDQELATCIPWSVVLSSPVSGTGHEQGMMQAAKEGMDQVKNPCTGSDKTFFDFPYNKYLYIMCVGSQPYMMPCPVGLVWDNDIKTCVRT